MTSNCVKSRRAPLSPILAALTAAATMTIWSSSTTTTLRLGPFNTAEALPAEPVMPRLNFPNGQRIIPIMNNRVLFTEDFLDCVVATSGEGMSVVDSAADPSLSGGGLINGATFTLVANDSVQCRSAIADPAACMLAYNPNSAGVAASQLVKLTCAMPADALFPGSAASVISTTPMQFVTPAAGGTAIVCRDVVTFLPDEGLGAPRGSGYVIFRIPVDDWDPIDQSTIKIVSEESALLFRYLDTAEEPYLYYCPDPSMGNPRFMDTVPDNGNDEWSTQSNNSAIIALNRWYKNLIETGHCFSMHSPELRDKFDHYHGFFLIEREPMLVATAGAIYGLLLTYAASDSWGTTCRGKITFMRQAGYISPPRILDIVSSNANPDGLEGYQKVEQSLLADERTFATIAESGFIAFNLNVAVPHNNTYYFALEITPIDVSPNCMRVCYTSNPATASCFTSSWPQSRFMMANVASLYLLLTTVRGHGPCTATIQIERKILDTLTGNTLGESDILFITVSTLKVVQSGDLGALQQQQGGGFDNLQLGNLLNLAAATRSWPSPNRTAQALGLLLRDFEGAADDTATTMMPPAVVSTQDGTLRVDLFPPVVPIVPTAALADGLVGDAILAVVSPAETSCAIAYSGDPSSSGGSDGGLVLSPNGVGKTIVVTELGKDRCVLKAQPHTATTRDTSITALWDPVFVVFPSDEPTTTRAPTTQPTPQVTEPALPETTATATPDATPAPPKKDDDNNQTLIIIIVVVVAVIVCLVLVAIIIWLCCCRQRVADAQRGRKGGDAHRVAMDDLNTVNASASCVPVGAVPPALQTGPTRSPSIGVPAAHLSPMMYTATLRGAQPPTMAAAVNGSFADGTRGSPRQMSISNVLAKAEANYDRNRYPHPTDIPGSPNLIVLSPRNATLRPAQATAAPMFTLVPVDVEAIFAGIGSPPAANLDLPSFAVRIPRATPHAFTSPMSPRGTMGGMGVGTSMAPGAAEANLANALNNSLSLSQQAGSPQRRAVAVPRPGEVGYGILSPTAAKRSGIMSPTVNARGHSIYGSFAGNAGSFQSNLIAQMQGQGSFAGHSMPDAPPKASTHPTSTQSPAANPPNVSPGFSYAVANAVMGSPSPQLLHHQLSSMSAIPLALQDPPARSASTSPRTTTATARGTVPKPGTLGGLSESLA